ncbi:hypothetical protein MDAP_001898 [Mitosporidium daphniae]
MTHTQNIFVATHQLPWVVVVQSEDPLEFVIKKSDESSGLYSGLHSLSKTKDLIFVGTLGNLPATLSSSNLEHIKAKLLEPPYNSIAILAPPNIVEGHEIYSTLILRPLLHYVISNAIIAKSEDEYSSWDSFVKLNALFAESIASLIKKDDIVWAIDYKLILLPNLIHNINRDAVLGYFHYAPFPSSEILRCVPQRKDIMSGLLGTTLVGFQHYSYASHFLSCCTRLLGLETFPTGVNFNDRTISVGIFPTGVNVEEIASLRDSSAVQENMKTLRDSFCTKKIIIGHERPSQINGVWHKLCSFEKFIEKYPDLAKNTILIQITSKNTLSESSKTEDKTFEFVSKINAKYGSIDHQPIHYFTHLFERENFLAALAEADVCVITSERDSTNNLAFEYVLCQKQRQSPLIISELIGNAANFTTALQVNPWDYQGVADSIYKALTMSTKEKAFRFEQLYRNVVTCNINDWGTIFLNELQDLSAAISFTKTIHLESSLIVAEYCKAKECLLLLDYDGTLVDIQPVPSAATPTARLLSVLERLAGNEKTHIFLISGRDQQTLDEWLGHIANLGFSAEHGCFLKMPGELWVNQLEELDISWKTDILSVFEYYTERTPGSFIEHKRSSITWHFRLADPDYGSWQANECLNHLESLIAGKGELEILPGKKNLEVRPKLVNKGQVISRLCQMYPESDFIFCVGDDRTDEDMFKCLKKLGKHAYDSTFSCTVGAKPNSTQAKYFLRSPNEVLNVLQLLAFQPN